VTDQLTASDAAPETVAVKATLLEGPTTAVGGATSTPTAPPRGERRPDASHAEVARAAIARTAIGPARLRRRVLKKG
jgi:hypothetical protein